MMRSLLTLTFKCFLLLAPFLVLGLYVVLHSQLPEQYQKAYLQDKIERLIIHASTTPRIIISGDSRAFFSVDPAVISKETGIDTTNAAVGFGVLPQIYDQFHETGVLNQKRLIVISISSYDINDAIPDNQPIDDVIFYRKPWGSEKLNDFTERISDRILFYVGEAKKFLRRDTDDPSHMSTQVYERNGYQESIGSYTPQPLGKDPNDSWYTHAVVRGFKQKDFVRAIDGLGHTNDEIILYTAPIAPSWKATLASTTGLAVEDNFKEVVRAAVEPYPNMHFIDFSSEEIPGLTDKQFADSVHLNTDGARIFSVFLARTLIKDGFIR